MSLWIKLLILGAIVSGLIGFGWTGGMSHERKAWKIKEAEQIAAQLEATNAAREREIELQFKVTEANNARILERQKADRIAAGLRTELGGMRDNLAAFIRGSATDTLPACIERGQAAGVVLLEAVSVAGEFAEAGETCEADKRALILAWPK